MPINNETLQSAIAAIHAWLTTAAMHGPAAAKALAENHPYQVAYYAASAGAVMVMGPGGLIAVPLRLIGFGTLGPIAGAIVLSSVNSETNLANRNCGYVVASDVVWWLRARRINLRVVAGFGNDGWTVIGVSCRRVSGSAAGDEHETRLFT